MELITQIHKIFAGSPARMLVSVLVVIFAISSGIPFDIVVQLISQMS